MEAFNSKYAATKFDWRWFVVGFCFLVLFHLLPSFFLLSSRISFSFLPSSLLAGFVIWLAAGIVGVSSYIGWRSAQGLFLEPAFASLAYCLVLMVAYNEPGRMYLINNLYNRYTFPVGLLIFSFVLGFTPASIISWLRIRNDANLPPA